MAITLSILCNKRQSIVSAMSKQFFSTYFNSLAAVERASPKFEQWYAQHYEPPTLNGSTPVQAQRGVKRLRVTARQVRAFPVELPITPGRLHFISTVAHARLLSLL